MLKSIFNSIIVFMQDLKVNKYFRIISGFCGFLSFAALIYVLVFQESGKIHIDKSSGFDTDPKYILLPALILFSIFIESAANMHRPAIQNKKVKK